MGIKISALPPVVTPALSDVFPIVQGGVTYKESLTQLATLIGSSDVSSITGTANQIIASSPTGAITLSTPQDINTTSDVTFGSVKFSPTTKGIVGTTTNDGASPGYVGEFISSVVPLGSPVVFVSTVDKDLTSISLTAGDWDVFGNIHASASTITQGTVWISLTSATEPDLSLLNTVLPLAASSVLGISAPYFRASLAATTTIYLSAAFTSTGTNNCCGGIYARRVR